MQQAFSPVQLLQGFIQGLWRQKSDTHNGKLQVSTVSARSAVVSDQFAQDNHPREHTQKDQFREPKRNNQLCESKQSNQSRELKQDNQSRELKQDNHPHEFEQLYQSHS